MEVKEALKKVGYLHNNPIVSECPVCLSPLNEESKVIMENREGIKYLVSHGLCPECRDVYIKKVEQSGKIYNY